MTLEEFTAQINATTFWKEFTFSHTKFSPPARSEVELADGLVKIGSLAFVFQMKERNDETTDPAQERKWFRKKVLGKAVSQIKDSLQYLRDHARIELTNDQGHTFRIEGSELKDIKKVVVFLAGRSLPDDCWRTKYHVSETAGFIHVVASHDYLGILEKLRVPDDIRLYFEYRESVLPRLEAANVVVEEPDIVVGFLLEMDLPEPGSIGKLRYLVQDMDQFDLSHIMRNLQDHIVNPTGSTEYYRIMEEFARVPRSIWRAFRQRFDIALKATKDREPRRPFRFSFPKTDCTFMVASLDPSWPSTGSDGLRMRANAVAMFTEAAKYDQRTMLGVGLVISKDGDYFQLDWCLVEEPWEPNPKIEDVLSTDLFGPAREQMVDSFLFHDEVDKDPG